MAHYRRNDFLIPTLGVLFDGIAIEFAFLLAYALRFNFSLFHVLPLVETKPPLDAYLYGSLVIIPVWLLIFHSRKMYGARRNIKPSDDFFIVVRLVTVGMLVVMSTAFFYRAFSYSRIVFGLLWGISIVAIFAGKIFLYTIERWQYRRGRDLRQAVIIGDSASANRIYFRLNSNPLLGYKFIGYFADHESLKIDPLGRANWLGRLADVPHLLKKYQIELALVAIDSREHDTLIEVIQECEGVNVEFMIVPDFVEIMTARLAMKEIEGIPFVRLKGVPMTTWGRISKRMYDVVFSFLLIILFSPLFTIIAVLIKLTSSGAVFFLQERVGMDGLKFKMIKFRSMRQDAESASGPVWAEKKDPRATHIGKLLRRTSLDELPQLFNVLKGEMSLVGPRPERPYFVDQFKRLVPKYLDRHRVKTGMTGWAQVNGLRGNSSLDERIKYDIYYIEHWSIGLDFKILLKTLKALL